jgi:hypothetical protein
MAYADIYNAAWTRWSVSATERLARIRLGDGLLSGVPVDPPIYAPLED